MKKILLFLFLFCAVCASSQVKTPEKEQSKLEAFSLRSGSLIEKQFTDVGEVKEVKVQVYILTDLISGVKISGLRLSKVVSDRYSSDSKTAALDLDEIDGLIKSINALKTKVFPSVRTSYTEIVYKSRGGFMAGAYFDRGK
jgi:vacuolar-type H+-ATPase subunit D/Vma8